MTKRIKLLLLLAFFCVVLTACGARVHTETSFQAGGSGNRIVFLEVALSDEGRIEGGFQKLESTLKANAPSCIQVNGYEDQKKNTMIYELKYEFSDIEDFKAKTKAVIGKEPAIQWKEEQGVFSEKVSYYEKTSTGELIQWVKTAMQEESISTAIISKLYEEENNVVSYEGEKVWSGTDTAKFLVDKNLELKDVSVYTNYNENGICTKQIKLGFQYEDYMAMDTEQGLAYLHAFSDKFKVDPSCNGYSVTLTGQKQLEKFFQKASGELSSGLSYDNLQIKKQEKNYFFENKSRKSIFTDYFSVKEVYNFNELLGGFHLGTQVVKDYVSIPERDSFVSEKLHHTYALEATKAYNYIGEYRIDDTYYLDFQGGRSCRLRKVSVEYALKDDPGGTQKVTLDIEPNGIKLKNNDIMEFYSNLGEKVQVEEENDRVIISFTKELRYGGKDKENDIFRSNTFNLHKTKYELATSFSLERYFPESSHEVFYRVSLPDSFSVEHFVFNGKTLKKKEIQLLKDGQQWTFEGSAKGSEETDVKISFSRINMIFYGALSIIVLLLIGTGLSIYFYIKSNRAKE